MGERGVRGRRRRAGTAAALAVLLGAVLPACGSAPSSSQGSDEQAAPRARQQTGWDTRPASLAAVGDSITRGFDACSVLADCPEASWATGSDPGVRSLALRLLGERGAAVAVYRDGRRVVDLWGGAKDVAGGFPEDGDRGGAWQRGTAQVVRSATKGVVYAVRSAHAYRRLLLSVVRFTAQSRPPWSLIQRTWSASSARVPTAGVL